MRSCSKLFLALTALLLGLSYTSFGSELLHGIPLPLAVVSFGLFLITWVFPEKDFDQFDEDQALRKQLLREAKRPRRPVAASPKAARQTSELFYHLP